MFKYGQNEEEEQEGDYSVDRTLELPQNYQIVKHGEESNMLNLKSSSDLNPAVPSTNREEDCDILELDEGSAF